MPQCPCVVLGVKYKWVQMSIKILYQFTQYIHLQSVNVDNMGWMQLQVSGQTTLSAVMELQENQISRTIWSLQQLRRMCSAMQHLVGHFGATAMLWTVGHTRPLQLRDTCHDALLTSLPGFWIGVELNQFWVWAGVHCFPSQEGLILWRTTGLAN